MNELKPEDVMRALVYCTMNGLCTDGCPLFEHRKTNLCGLILNKNALALLREKDARIKELEEAQGAEFTCFVGDPHKVDHCPYGDELARLHKEVAEKDAEIERLTAYNANLICANTDITNRHKDYVEEAERIARADAITEFAERLKANNPKTVGCDVFYPFVYFETIDQIAKEMKEGKNGETDL